MSSRKACPAYAEISWRSGKKTGETTVTFDDANTSYATICGQRVALTLKGQAVEVTFVGGKGEKTFGCSRTTVYLAAPDGRIVTLTARLFPAKEAPKRRQRSDDKLSCVRRRAASRL